MNVISKLSPKDYASDQDLRWCPGCGDYAILKAVQKTFADLAVDPANAVFISGIGCAARFPYYMATYGFHTIHGRAAAIATGAKMANPDLDIWVVAGDGDSLSIGGNHLLHLLRRNVDLVYLMFNNEIYGLTKGQASPTSRRGTRSPTTPSGSRDEPVHAARFALGASASFVARAVDVNQKHLVETLKRAHAHEGVAFVEILQNCIVFNDGVYASVSDKKQGPEHALELVHGQPMIWGANRDKGLIFDLETMSLKAVPVGNGGVAEADILIHDETNRTLAGMLSVIDGEPGMPTPIGVLYARPAATFDTGKPADTAAPDEVRKRIGSLLHSGHTWNVI
ncbi:MAG: 2-oxoacid:ferredoxin oxidoreductase subunit beta [Hyphomicrobiales bacterium]|nr:2-oxoacid:ferredoxin oxidoreductase subunit beta [Hyphomicrobiales bacterium]